MRKSVIKGLVSRLIQNDDDPPIAKERQEPLGAEHARLDALT